MTEILFETTQENMVYVTYFRIIDIDHGRDKRYELNIASSSVVAKIRIDAESLIVMRKALNDEYNKNKEEFRKIEKELMGK